jgi:hypothetical protein
MILKKLVNQLVFQVAKKLKAYLLGPPVIFKISLLKYRRQFCIRIESQTICKSPNKFYI